MTHTLLRNLSIEDRDSALTYFGKQKGNPDTWENELSPDEQEWLGNILIDTDKLHNYESAIEVIEN